MQHGVAIDAQFETIQWLEVYSFNGLPPENYRVDLEFGDGSVATILPSDDLRVDESSDEHVTSLPADIRVGSARRSQSTDTGCWSDWLASWTGYWSWLRSTTTLAFVLKCDRNPPGYAPRGGCG